MEVWFIKKTSECFPFKDTHKVIYSHLLAAVINVHKYAASSTFMKLKSCFWNLRVEQRSVGALCLTYRGADTLMDSSWRLRHEWMRVWATQWHPQSDHFLSNKGSVYRAIVSNYDAVLQITRGVQASRARVQPLWCVSTVLWSVC